MQMCFMIMPSFSSHDFLVIIDCASVRTITDTKGRSNSRMWGATHKETRVYLNYQSMAYTLERSNALNLVGGISAD